MIGFFFLKQTAKDMVALLLDYGADANYSISESAVDAVADIISAAHGPDALDAATDIIYSKDRPDEDFLPLGSTALMLACRSGWLALR